MLITDCSPHVTLSEARLPSLYSSSFQCDCSFLAFKVYVFSASLCVAYTSAVQRQCHSSSKWQEVICFRNSESGVGEQQQRSPPAHERGSVGNTSVPALPVFGHRTSSFFFFLRDELW